MTGQMHMPTRINRRHQRAMVRLRRNRGDVAANLARIDYYAQQHQTRFLDRHIRQRQMAYGGL
jgi:hypothetical protein